MLLSSYSRSPRVYLYSRTGLPRTRSAHPHPWVSPPEAASSWSWCLPSPAAKHTVSGLEVCVTAGTYGVENNLTSTTAELFSALAINFLSVVNFFILLKDTRSDISTSNKNVKVSINEISNCSCYSHGWKSLSHLNSYMPPLKLIKVYDFVICKMPQVPVHLSTEIHLVGELIGFLEWLLKSPYRSTIPQSHCPCHFLIKSSVHTVQNIYICIVYTPYIKH